MTVSHPSGSLTKNLPLVKLCSHHFGLQENSTFAALLIRRHRYAQEPFVPGKEENGNEGKRRGRRREKSYTGGGKGRTCCMHARTWCIAPSASLRGRTIRCSVVARDKDFALANMFRIKSKLVFVVTVQAGGTGPTRQPKTRYITMQVPASKGNAYTACYVTRCVRHTRYQMQVPLKC